jgi:sortase A
MKEELSRGVVHYAGTARPGESGNVGLTGHSSNYWWDKGAYNYVFTNLDKLAPGDEVTLYHAGLTYRYRMTGSRVVPPEQAEVLAPTPTNQLTLITCWPRFTDWKRLVVSLEQIDPPAPAAQGGGNRLPDA